MKWAIEEGRALRIIAGRFRSRRLQGPPTGVRPTSDRVREALYSRLGDVAGLNVLDLFAGTGALGLEALSRGAQSVTFVDASSRSVAVVRANLESLDLDSETRVLRADARAAVGRLSQEGARFGLVLLDPPYDEALLGPVLDGLVRGDLLEEDATVVTESRAGGESEIVAGLSLTSERCYGDTAIRLFRWSGSAAPEPTTGGERRR